MEHLNDSERPRLGVRRIVRALLGGAARLGAGYASLGEGFAAIGEGYASIARGASTFSLAPQPTELPELPELPAIPAAEDVTD